MSLRLGRGLDSSSHLNFFLIRRIIVHRGLDCLFVFAFTFYMTFSAK